MARNRLCAMMQWIIVAIAVTGAYSFHAKAIMDKDTVIFDKLEARDVGVARDKQTGELLVFAGKSEHLADSLKLIAQIKEPVTLSCHGADLTDEQLAPLANMKSLRKLNLYMNPRLTSIGIAHLIGLKDLHSLIIDPQQDVDGIYNQIGNIEGIRHLDLTYAKADDKALRHIAKLRRLLKLTLSEQELTDTAIVSIQPLANVLEELALDGSNVTDDGVKNLSKFKKLKGLVLSSPLVTDRSIESLSRLSTLKRLSVNACAITGKSLELLSACPLTYLSLNDTCVDDSAIESILQLKGLTGLSVLSTRISKKGVRRLKKKLPNCVIYN